MRKMMSKEVTFTTLKIAKIEMLNGSATVVELPEEIIMGTISKDKAQKAVNKKHNSIITILSHTENSDIYEMSVEDFVKQAKIQTKQESDDRFNTYFGASKPNIRS